MDILINVLYYVLPFIALLGILVFIHEFGHFIVARMLGVQVVTFSIGFGKKLWSRTDSQGTMWQISAIPLGGYCQFLGDADASSSTVDNKVTELSAEEKAKAFPFQKTWKKLAIVVAGPLFNYLLAIVVFFGVFYAYGKMVYPPVIGEIMENSAAQEAGIQVGDKIITLNGKHIPDFQTMSNEIALAETDDVVVEIERPINVSVPADEYSRIVQNIAPLPTGILATDTLIAVNNTLLADNQNPEITGDEVSLTYKRNLKLNVSLKTTQYSENNVTVKRRLLGVKSTPQLTFSQDLTFTQAVSESFTETYNLTVMTLRGVWQMITGQRGGNEVGGIIRIAEMSGDVSKTGGFIGFVYFLALLSVNLGLINLFPIPVLDGGSIVIFTIEMLIGKELKPNIKEHIFRVGLLIILAIMVLATWNDIAHLISRWFD